MSVTLRQHQSFTEFYVLRFDRELAEINYAHLPSHAPAARLMRSINAPAAIGLLILWPLMT
jgi:hypothetical protein